jgi:hypothetical protein
VTIRMEDDTWWVTTHVTKKRLSLAGR